MSQVVTLYSDKEKTDALYPRTKVSGISDDNNTSLEELLNRYEIIDNLTSNATDKALSANQGKGLNDNKANKSDVLTLEEIQASTDLTGKIASASALKDLKSTLGPIDVTTYTAAQNSSMDIPINYKNCYLVVGVHVNAGAWCRFIKTINNDIVSIVSWDGANLGESLFTVTSVDRSTINVAVGGIGGACTIHLIRLGFGGV